MKIVSTSLILLITSLVNCQEKVSPCPRILTYALLHDTSDTWHGTLKLDTQIKLYGIYVDLLLDRPANNVTALHYEVKNKNNVDFKIEDSGYELDVGDTLSLNFSVKYNSYGRIPLVKEVRFNGQRICVASSNNGVREVYRTSTSNPINGRPTISSLGNGQPVQPVQPVLPVYETRPNRVPVSTNNQQGDIVFESNSQRITTSTTLRPTPRPNNNQFNNEEPEYGRVTRRPVDNTGRVTPTTTTQRPGSAFIGNSFTNNDVVENSFTSNQNVRPTTTSSPYFQGDLAFSKGKPHSIVSNPDDNTCGTVVAKAKPLVVFGEPTIAGQFPWHAALYLSLAEQLKYICGAALISRRTLLTVAHCVCNEQSETPIDPDTLLVYLGKYNLRKWTGHEQDGKVSEIIVHSDYDHSRFYSDIAILRLKNDITINNYVRPVCLWSHNTDLKSVVNKNGEVAGWGHNENGVISEVLSSVTMPIVAHETCIWSNRDFFSRVTSDRAFCAGFRNQSSVCSGDSGGGMVFKYNSQWFLRGLVSLSVALQNKLRCDPNEYAVFTDVAKFLTWIQEKM